VLQMCLNFHTLYLRYGYIYEVDGSSRLRAQLLTLNKYTLCEYVTTLMGNFTLHYCDDRTGRHFLGRLLVILSMCRDCMPSSILLVGKKKRSKKVSSTVVFQGSVLGKLVLVVFATWFCVMSRD
jgi:hypothetical protein